LALEARDGVEYDQFDHCFSKDQPENFDFLKLIRNTIEEINPEATTIGEIGGIQELDKLIELAASYVKDNEHLHMVYTFSLLGSKIQVKSIAEIVETTEKNIGNGWPCWSFGNHDCARVRTRCDRLGLATEYYQNIMLFAVFLWFFENGK